MNEAQAISIVRHALRSLSERALTILSMVMTFALALWAMYRPTWERDAMTIAFAVLVFLPAIWHDKRRLKNEVPQIQTEPGPQAG